jgi:N-acetyl-gamma-glutamyl-phosphate reductase
MHNPLTDGPNGGNQGVEPNKRNGRTMSENKIRIAILGASGYTGAELVRLLSRHPNAEIVVLTADRKAGMALSDVFPHLRGLGLPDLISIDDVEWAGVDVDVVFCALPHGTTQEIVAGLLHQTGHGLVDELVVEERKDLISGISKDVKVIDLSADFRLENTDTYAKWYGHEHYAPHLQGAAVYGLAEFNREALKDTRLIACPGCFPTSAILGLWPLLEAKVIDQKHIIIDAKTGVSGAGRALKETLLFGEVGEGMNAYAIASHRHGPEIDQELTRASDQDIAVTFTPHLVPMVRGILSTTYVEMAEGKTIDDLRKVLEDRYADEPFVRMLPEGVGPSTHNVRGSNYCDINVFADRVAGRAIVVSAIDNLVKGASGAAVQNMNIAFGLEETTGLEQQPIYP